MTVRLSSRLQICLVSFAASDSDWIRSSSTRHLRFVGSQFVTGKVTSKIVSVGAVQAPKARKLGGCFEFSRIPRIFQNKSSNARSLYRSEHESWRRFTCATTISEKNNRSVAL